MESKEIGKEKTTSSEGTVENEEEEDSYFQDIYILAEHGIDIADIEKLRKIGINTLKGLQMTTTACLCKEKVFTKEKVKQLREICDKISVNNCYQTALEVSEQRKQIFQIGTGSSNLDKLLGGGIQSMSVTEVFGEAGTGKSQIAHTLCVSAQIPNNEYPGGKVMFIDTEHTFRPERIRQIARRYNLAEDGVLENIIYIRAYNSEHQYQILKHVGSKFHAEPGMFKLLIVDSIIALFRIDFSGRNELAKRQQKLGQVMSTLQNISEEFNIAVFITNQIMSDFKFPLLQVDILNNDSSKPVGGNILAHCSTTRIALKKVVGNVRIAKLYDSPELEEGEVSFIITTGGINDPKLDE